MGRGFWVGVGTLSALLLVSWLAGNTATSDAEMAARAAAAAASQARAKAAADAQRAADECKASLPARRDEYKRLSTKGEHWAASLQLRECAELLKDDELQRLVEAAEVKSHLQAINDPRSTGQQKLDAYRALERDHPKQAEAFTKNISALQAKWEKQDRDAAAAERRKRGVSIGMSAEDVLASSWGKPERVNRTTTAYGTREQWVYGIGQYLYFEDGKLTAIQQ